MLLNYRQFYSINFNLISAFIKKNLSPKEIRKPGYSRHSISRSHVTTPLPNGMVVPWVFMKGNATSTWHTPGEDVFHRAGTLIARHLPQERAGHRRNPYKSILCCDSQHASGH